MGPIRRLARRLLVRSGRWERWRRELHPEGEAPKGKTGAQFSDFLAAASAPSPVVADATPVVAPEPVVAPVLAAPAPVGPAPAEDWRKAFEAALAKLEAEEVDDVPAPAPLPPRPPAPLQTSSVAGGLDPVAVERVLEELVRPALHADGGDITLVSVEGGVVRVNLVGACHSCPSSVVTLRLGVERLLADEFPGFEELIQVNAPDEDYGH